jgi:hypothetical protein
MIPDTSVIVPGGVYGGFILFLIGYWTRSDYKWKKQEYEREQSRRQLWFSQMQKRRREEPATDAGFRSQPVFKRELRAGESAVLPEHGAASCIRACRRS